MFSKCLISLLFALLPALGCVNARLIVTDGSLALKPNEGILVVHVDSDFPIRRLILNPRIIAARDLSAGESLALVVVPAGNYRWMMIDVPKGLSGAFSRFRLRRDSNWSFKVAAGHINYSGQIVVKEGSATLFSGYNLWAWTKNRAAMALEQIRATYPILLAQFPLANGRSERDDFLELYQNVGLFESPKASEAPPN